MKIIICVDDNMGMAFNHRRQSQDRILRGRILKLSAKTQLWMNHYSEQQFSFEDCAYINYTDNFLCEASKDDYCFVETDDITPFLPYIEELVLYRWNRVYPSDQKLQLDLSKWKMIGITDFPGNSHEIITEEVYIPL